MNILEIKQSNPDILLIKTKYYEIKKNMIMYIIIYIFIIFILLINNI